MILTKRANWPLIDLGEITGTGKVSTAEDRCSRLQEIIAAEVAKNQDEINDEIGRLKSQFSHVGRIVQPDTLPPCSHEVAQLQDRIEKAFAMLDKKADIFEMEKKANL